MTTPPPPAPVVVQLTLVSIPRTADLATTLPWSLRS
jgi:hypothetical protein